MRLTLDAAVAEPVHATGALEDGPSWVQLDGYNDHPYLNYTTTLSTRWCC